MRPNIIIIEKGYATIGYPSGRTITTTYLNKDHYVRIDDGRQYPQLCWNAASTGPTITYYNDEELARACNARMFKTRKGFDAALKRMEEAYA